MRNRYALLVVLIALAAVTTMSVTGQEEPLPAGTPRAAAPVQYIALAVEPIRPHVTPTLADAARRHDYVTFHALYATAKANGENVAAYDALHQLWSWSMSDPIGAFYGAEMHARLSSAYPGFARYIDDFKIVDSRGHVFYPTSETRRFLLDRAVEGRAPRVLVAETRNAVEAPVKATRATTTSAASTPVPSRPRTDASPARRSATPAGAPSVTAPKVTKAAVVPAPTVTASAAAPVVATPPAAQRIATAAPAPAPVTAAPVDAAPVVATSPAEQAPEPAAVPQASQPIARNGGFANRGILLLVIGIVGIGLLAVMLRTPQETTMPSILQPPAVPPAEKAAAGTVDATTVAPVEPLRRPAKGDAKRAS